MAALLALSLGCGGSAARDPGGTSPGDSRVATSTGTDVVDLSREPFSYPSGIAFEGGSVWVSNYVSGGTGPLGGPGAPIIYRYDLSTGRPTGSIPSPSQWTSGLAFDGTALLVTDHTDATRLFRLSPDTGAILSSFELPYEPMMHSVAVDGSSIYVVDGALSSQSGTAVTYQQQITIYSASGVSTGVVYARSSSWNPGATPGSLNDIRGLAYGGETLWALVAPAATGAPYRLLNLSVTGEELSTIDLPGTAGRELSCLGYDGSFWTIELLPMSIVDLSVGKLLVRLSR